MVYWADKLQIYLIGTVSWRASNTPIVASGKRFHYFDSGLREWFITLVSCN